MNKKFVDSHSFSIKWNKNQINTSHLKSIIWIKNNSQKDILTETNHLSHSESITLKKWLTTEKNLSEQKLFHWREIVWYQTRKIERFNQDSVHDFMVLFNSILSINSVIHFDNFIFMVFIIFVELFLFIFSFFQLRVLPFSTEFYHFHFSYFSILVI